MNHLRHWYQVVTNYSNRNLTSIGVKVINGVVLLAYLKCLSSKLDTITW